MAETHKLEKNSETIFTPDFEEKILQAILGEEHFALQILEVLEPGYFETKYIEALAKIIIKYHAEYSAFPTVSLLETLCLEELSQNELLRKQCLSYLERIKKNPLNGDAKYVMDRSLSFFRTQSVKMALAKDILPKLKSENLDEIMPILQEALIKGTSKNIGYEYHVDGDERFHDEPFDKIPVPWAEINKILDGGLGSKRLFTLLGTPGGCKSHFLVNLGSAALLSPKEDGTGRTVVHYTLELSHIDVARRYDACLTGVSINDVIHNKEKILFTLKQKLPKGAKLIIKEYPMKTASVQTIKAHLAKLRINGVIPDYILIDYGDLLADDTETRGALWVSMKTLAQELEIPVATVTQTNRAGYDDEVITLDKVAEDFQKIMHSDVIFTISRHKILFVGKNRQGYDGQKFRFKIDTAKCKFELETENMNTIDELAKALNTPKQKDEFSAIDSYLKKNELNKK